MPNYRPSLRALLIDISGNLHIGSTPTPNAVEAFQRLRASGIPFRLCSNASKESTSVLIARLNDMGFKVGPECERSGSTHTSTRKEVWTSIGSVAQFIKDLGLKRPYLLLSKSAREEVVAAAGSQVDRTTAVTDKSGPDYDSVVVGLAPDVFDYHHLNTAFRILMGENKTESGTSSSSSNATKRPRAPLIATHKAKYVQKESSPGLSLGPGPFVRALEFATGYQAQVVGKPTKTFFEQVIRDFSPSDHRTHSAKRDDAKIAVIGDDIETDLGEGAVELGLWRVLVKTGKYRSGDENKSGVVPPDEVFDSFAAFIDDLLPKELAISSGTVPKSKIRDYSRL